MKQFFRSWPLLLAGLTCSSAATAAGYSYSIRGYDNGQLLSVYNQVLSDFTGDIHESNLTKDQGFYEDASVRISTDPIPYVSISANPKSQQTVWACWGFACSGAVVTGHTSFIQTEASLAYYFTVRAPLLATKNLEDSQATRPTAYVPVNVSAKYHMATSPGKEVSGLWTIGMNENEIPQAGAHWANIPGFASAGFLAEGSSGKVEEYTAMGYDPHDFILSKRITVGHSPIDGCDENNTKGLDCHDMAAGIFTGKFLVAIPSWEGVGLGHVILGARAEAFSTGTTTAFVDPFFSIDSEWLAANPGYSIEMPNGIGNTASVQEPSVCVFLLTGLAIFAARSVVTLRGHQMNSDRHDGLRILPS